MKYGINLLLIILFFVNGLHGNADMVTECLHNLCEQAVISRSELLSKGHFMDCSTQVEDETVDYVCEIAAYLSRKHYEFPDALSQDECITYSDYLFRIKTLMQEAEWSECNDTRNKVTDLIAEMLQKTVLSDNKNTRETSGKAEAIVEAALGAEGKSDVIYGVDCYTSTTQNGVLACAAVVSAILREAKCENKIHLACVNLREHLESDLGWTEYSKDECMEGDVCFWRKNSSDRPRHVGIIVERDRYRGWWAIDNSSSDKKVLKRPLDRDYYPVVDPVSRVN